MAHFGKHIGMKRKKILFITRPLAGGMLTHLQSLLNFFADRWDVSLAAPDFPFLLQRREKVRFFPLPLQDGLRPPRDLSVLMRLLQIFREIRPDLLHIHGYRAAMVGLPAAWFAHCPALVTVHNFLAYPDKSFIPKHFFQRAVKFLDPAVTNYIAVSEALRRELAGFGISPPKILKIYNGIDPGLFAAGSHNNGRQCRDPGERGLAPLLRWKGIRVGTAGRLVHEKGFDLFIQAASRVAGIIPETGFFLAGKGPERERLERLSISLGMEKRFFFLGEVRDMPAFFSCLDLFVLASRSEGLSISLLEAGAAGVSRLASDVGGIPEIVCHGKSGFLFPPGDIGALARQLIRLAQRPLERARLGKCAEAEIAAVFTEKRMLGETEKVYENILQKEKWINKAGIN